MLDMIHYNKFPFTDLQWKLTCLEKPSSNSCHESNTTIPNLPSHFINTDLNYLQVNNAAAQSVQWLRYTLEGVEFKSWQKQENYFTTKTSRPAPATTLPTTQWKPVGQLYFTSTSYLCTSLSRSHILSDLTKEPFYTLLSLTCTLHDPFISSSLIQLH